MWALVGPPVLTACPSWNWEELELQGCWSSSGLLRRVGTGRGGLSLPGSLSLSAPLPSPPPGVSSNVVPMYLGELAPKNLRGALGVVPQLFITIGILVAQLFGLRSILANQKGEYGLPETGTSAWSLAAPGTRCLWGPSGLLSGGVAVLGTPLWPRPTRQACSWHTAGWC